MTATFPVNGKRVRHAMLEQGISERALGVSLNVGFVVVRTMINNNEISGALTIAALYKILNECGLTPSQLLDPETEEYPDNTPLDDTAQLAQILTSDKRMLQPHALAIALGWSTERVRDTAASLDTHLRPLGLFIHNNGMGMTIRPVDDRSAKARRKLDYIRDSDEGMNHSLATALYQVFKGIQSKKDSKASEKFMMGALLNRGAINMGDNRRSHASLSADTAYCFDVPD